MILDHVHLRSPDPDETARFYVDMFDAASIGRQERDGKVRVTVELSGTRLFIEHPTGDAAITTTPLGLEHLGFRVGDLDATVTRLRERGARFSTEPQTLRPGLRIAFVQAPDGVRVELLERS